MEEKYLGDGNGELNYFNFLISFLPFQIFNTIVTPWIIYKMYPPEGGEEDWQLVEEPDAIEYDVEMG